MMKCSRCSGSGQILVESDNGLGWYPAACPVCRGRGYHSFTNKDWLDKQSVKEKAAWLALICSKALADTQKRDNCMMTADFWEEWLEKEHKNGELL